MSSQSQTDQSERDYSNFVLLSIYLVMLQKKRQKIHRWKDYCSHFVINLIFFFFFFLRSKILLSVLLRIVCRQRFEKLRTLVALLSESLSLIIITITAVYKRDKNIYAMFVSLLDNIIIQFIPCLLVHPRFLLAFYNLMLSSYQKYGIERKMSQSFELQAFHSSANWRKTAVLAPAENSASVIFFRLRISENPRSDPIELTSPVAIYETSSGVRKREYFPLVALRISETRLSLDLYPVDLRPFDFWRQNCLKLVGSLAIS